MNQKSTGVRIAPFIMGILFFILPFIQVSCQAKKMMQFTGVQLVTGSEMTDPMSGETKKIPPTGLAVVTLVALMAGAGACLSTTRGRSVAAAIAGGVAAVAMIVLKVRTDADITKQAAGLPITVEYLAGFWLVLLAAIAGLVMSIMRVKAKASEPTIATPP